MRFYGDEVETLQGKISMENSDFLKIFFENAKKSAYVPRLLIKNKISSIEDLTQDFVIPKWFLRKQRIISY